MTNKVDMHIHSTYSDGTDSIEEILEQAKKIGLTEIAITDHDCIAGVERAIALGKTLGITVHSGVELSTVFNGLKVHLLAYDFDPKDERLTEFIYSQCNLKNEQSIRMFKLIRRDYPQIPTDALKKILPNRVGRPYLANLLKVYVPQFANKTTSEIMESTLCKGSKYYIEKSSNSKNSLEKAITIIAKAKGKSVIAHPIALGLSEEKLFTMLKHLKLVGLFGIECEYPSHTEMFRGKIRQIAKELNLNTTCGSDYHGSEKKNRLGETDFFFSETIMKQLEIDDNSKLQEAYKANSQAAALSNKPKKKGKKKLDAAAKANQAKQLAENQARLKNTPQTCNSDDKAARQARHQALLIEHQTNKRIREAAKKAQQLEILAQQKADKTAKQAAKNIGNIASTLENQSNAPQEAKPKIIQAYKSPKKQLKLIIKNGNIELKVSIGLGDGVKTITVDNSTDQPIITIDDKDC